MSKFGTDSIISIKLNISIQNAMKTIWIPSNCPAHNCQSNLVSDADSAIWYKDEGAEMHTQKKRSFFHFEIYVVYILYIFFSSFSLSFCSGSISELFVNARALECMHVYVSH